MQAQTVNQEHVLMHLNNIHTDINVLIKNGVNGELLGQLTAEDDVKSLVVIDDSGDCRRVTQLVSDKGIPPPFNIYNADGKNNDPSTRSVQQLAEHLTKNSALKGAQEMIVNHKLAGDIIVDMGLDLVSSMLPMSALQKIAFKKEINSLHTQ